MSITIKNSNPTSDINQMQTLIQKSDTVGQRLQICLHSFADYFPAQLVQKVYNDIEQLCFEQPQLEDKFLTESYILYRILTIENSASLEYQTNRSHYFNDNFPFINVTAINPKIAINFGLNSVGTELFSSCDKQIDCFLNYYLLMHRITSFRVYLEQNIDPKKSAKAAAFSFCPHLEMNKGLHTDWPRDLVDTESRQSVSNREPFLRRCLYHSDMTRLRTLATAAMMTARPANSGGADNRCTCAQIPLELQLRNNNCACLAYFAFDKLMSKYESTQSPSIDFSQSIFDAITTVMPACCLPALKSMAPKLAELGSLPTPSAPAETAKVIQDAMPKIYTIVEAVEKKPVTIAPNHRHLCVECMKFETVPGEFKVCGKCKQFKLMVQHFYCSPKCQKSHWREHKRLHEVLTDFEPESNENLLNDLMKLFQKVINTRRPAAAAEKKV